MLDCTGTQRCLLAVSCQNGTDENSLQHKNPGIKQPFCSLEFASNLTEHLCLLLPSKKAYIAKLTKSISLPNLCTIQLPSAHLNPILHFQIEPYFPRLNVCWLLQRIIWIHSIFHPITCSMSLVAEKNRQSDNIHQGILVRKCYMKIKILIFRGLGNKTWYCNQKVPYRLCCLMLWSWQVSSLDHTYLFSQIPSLYFWTLKEHIPHLKSLKKLKGVFREEIKQR